MNKERVLEVLRENKEFYLSGQELSQRLKVFPSQIWEYVNELRKEGYSIDIQPHLGFRLLGVPDLLLPSEVTAGLKTRIVGRKVYAYGSTTSTNDVALKLAEEGAPEGTIVVAERQTRGRGRMGRPWLSPFGVGLWFSLILKPQIPPAQATRMTMVASVAVAKSIREMTGLGAAIKWPNDILIGERKVCGILTEMGFEFDLVSYVVVGIGLNVNLEAKDLLPLGKNATSLKEKLGSKVPRLELLKRILEEVESTYFLLREEGFEPIYQEWKDLSSTLGSKVKVVSPDGALEGLAFDLDSEGALILRLENGFLGRVFSGEVTTLEVS